MTIITRAGKGSALTHTEMDTNFTELDTRPTGQVYPAASGVGIKVDNASPDWGWHDIVGFLFIENGGSSPDYNIYRGGIKAYQFTEQVDESFIDFHMPHDYVPGTDLYMHAHWSHNSPILASGSVTFGFEIMYAKGHDQAAFGEPVIATILQTANTTPYQHLIAETLITSDGGSANTLDVNQMEVDGILQCRVYVDSNDTHSVSGVVEPFIHFVDIHYQSTNLPTKNKAPNFYG